MVRLLQDNTALHLLLVILSILTVSIVTEAVLAGVKGNSTGRIYGTWRARRVQRRCKQDLFCRYKTNDCMNRIGINDTLCDQLTRTIEENCIMIMCDRKKGQMCLIYPQGPEFIMVESDSCSPGTRCYMERPPVTTTTEPPTQPSGLGTVDLPTELTGETQARQETTVAPLAEGPTPSLLNEGISEIEAGLLPAQTTQSRAAVMEVATPGTTEEKTGGTGLGDVVGELGTREGIGPGTREVTTRGTVLGDVVGGLGTGEGIGPGAREVTTRGTVLGDVVGELGTREVTNRGTALGDVVGERGTGEIMAPGTREVTTRGTVLGDVIGEVGTREVTNRGTGLGDVVGERGTREVTTQGTGLGDVVGERGTREVTTQGTALVDEGLGDKLSRLGGTEPMARPTTLSWQDQLRASLMAVARSEG